jgi:murein DD-endopeptidase MepM/ murein hydrolase activator NlpD
MTGEHKAALATAGFLLTLGACSILSLPRSPDGGAAARELIIPVAGVAASALVDSWGAPRAGGHRHEGVDIMAEAGTPVRATATGTIVKLFTSKRGGITIYQRDVSGRYVFYYAHLSGYSVGLKEGMAVEQGQVIAQVGQTGNATTPHLHFEVQLADAEGRWWRGQAVNPYLALKAGRVEGSDGAATEVGR